MKPTLETLSDFARQLEQELKEANQKVERLTAAHIACTQDWIDVSAERDQLKTALSGRTFSCENCNEVAKERDQLREVADALAFRLERMRKTPSWNVNDEAALELFRELPHVKERNAK